MIRLATLTIASSESGPAGVLQQNDPPSLLGYTQYVVDLISHINETAELLEVASSISGAINVLSQKKRWLLVRCFLWNN